MTAKSAEEILGLEFDWLASDGDGRVALFTTAGGGYAPERFLRHTEAHEKAIDAILGLPTSTAARFAPQLDEGHQNTWAAVAERGLFAFDSDFNGGPYRLVAAPVVPVLSVALPRAVAEVVSLVVFMHLKFSDLTEVPKELLFERR